MFSKGISNIIAVLLLAMLPMVAMYAEGNSPDASIYASSSVLANGKWAKIRVSSTGIQKITSDVVRQAGFSDLSRIKVFGYGGNLIPERLKAEWIKEHDDLKEVPTCNIGGAKYFFGEGPVSYTSASSSSRTRNPYSDYGYYFITEGDGGLTCSEQELVNTASQSASLTHCLYENDEYSWSEMGRNLVEKAEIKPGKSKTVEITIPEANTQAFVYVCLTIGSNSAGFRIKCGDRTTSGTLSVPSDNYKGYSCEYSFSLTNLASHATPDGWGNYTLPVVVENTGTQIGSVRIDYILASFTNPSAVVTPSSGGCPTVEFVENVGNQNHHADTPVDYVIIVPTSGVLNAVADKLGQLHNQYDGMTYRVVSAKELYNEFSSGTPDVSAYKRYLRMFYDRDKTKYPKHVVLFGDCMWDNRMTTLSKEFRVDDYLLGYQTNESYNLAASTVADDFIGVMKDDITIHGEGYTTACYDGLLDVAVGRIPVVSATDAVKVVEKIERYIKTTPAGDWQNEIMFIGDDAVQDNDISHMRNINDNADNVIKNSPGYNVKKIMLDAYEIKSTSVGDRYPEATAAIKKQQNNGALIMNYGGHSSWTELSHQKVLELNDFINFRGSNYSIWFTAGCETVPFDQSFNTMGEAALLNADGGAIAFIGTARSVYEDRNTILNKAFMRYVLSYDAEGNPLTVGEALRLAKNELSGNTTGKATDRSINKHQYALIGDPALRMPLPKCVAVIDEINGVSSQTVQSIKGNSIVTVKGHIQNRQGEKAGNFNGVASVIVRDSKQSVRCRGNDAGGLGKNVVYDDRTSMLYKGLCSVENGVFTFTFRVPRDIYNDSSTGLITVYARDENLRLSANGESSCIKAEGWEDVVNDMAGPDIFAYLNNENFQNGGTVGITPYFVAEVSDKDGINCTGSSIGHNMELCIDKDASLTFNLDDNFQFDYGSYTNGQTYYVLPPLAPGRHTLTFRAWDLLNNSSTTSLDFVVNKAVVPELVNVTVAPNPVKTSCYFHLTHDMRGSDAQIFIDIISPMSQEVTTIEWKDTFSETSSTTSYHWMPAGLPNGLYLYRVRVTCDGNHYVTKSKKLIIAQ